MKTNEQGQIDIGTEETPAPTFVLNRGGRLELCLRADTEADWIREAKIARLLTEVEVDDGQGGTVMVDRPAPGVHIKQIEIEITPAVVDPVTGEVTTPAVMDTRPHFDVIIEEPAISNSDNPPTPNWHLLAASWMSGAALQASEKNQSENGRKKNGITLLDTTTFTRAHVYL